MNSVLKTMSRRKAAFDIGSGTIKLQIGCFDSNNNISSIVYGTERPCLFGEDWQKSKDGNLSTDIQESGLKMLGTLKTLAAEEHGVTEFYGVATEVFRKAPNGISYLERVGRELKIPTAVVTQAMEAEIGYATGVAAIKVADVSVGSAAGSDESAISTNSLVIWDSGAASFQMTTRNNSSDAEPAVTDTAAASTDFLMYMAPFGTSVVNSHLRAIKMKSATAAIAAASSHHPTSLPSSCPHLNPVSATDIDTLVSTLMESFPKEVPCWLQAGRGQDCSVDSTFDDNKNGGNKAAKKLQIVSIGGRNSMFQTARRILQVDRQQQQTDVGSLAAVPPSPAEDSLMHITLENLEHCIALCTNKTNEELLKYCDFEHSDGPGSTVSKLCLFYSVMKHLELQAISTVCTVGSCSGVLNTPRFWT